MNKCMTHFYHFGYERKSLLKMVDVNLRAYMQIRFAAAGLMELQQAFFSPDWKHLCQNFGLCL